MSNLKLEVGKRYLTRDGQVALITGHGDSPSPDPERARLYEFAGTVDGEAGTLEWRGDGVFDDDQGATMFDLIREIIDEPAPLRLQVGKRYRDGYGNEVLITLCDESILRWPFVTGDGTFRFNESGESIIGDVSPERNLVSEITDSEPAPPEEFTPPEFVEASAPLQLEVGKFYRARNGEIAEIREAGNGSDEYHAFSGKLPGTGTIQWSADGRYWNFGEDDWDLIEEVPAPVAEAVAEMGFSAEPDLVTHVFRDTGAVPDDTLFVQREPSPSIGQQLADRERARALTHDDEDEADRQFGRQSNRDMHSDMLRTGHSVRFANYARGILFVLLGLAAIMIAAPPAQARELLSIPNNAGGEIILTDTPSEHCDGAARLAISRAAGGKTIVGCWVYSDAGYVYVKWGDDLRLYKLTDFRIIEQFDEQPAPAPTNHRTPWRGA